MQGRVGRGRRLPGRPCAGAGRIGFDAETRACLWQVFEMTWLDGPGAATAPIAERRGTALDPRVVDAFASSAPALLSRLDADSAWDEVLDAEPGDPSLRPATGVRPVSGGGGASTGSGGSRCRNTCPGPPGRRRSGRTGR